jgi:hypothetical protein
LTFFLHTPQVPVVLVPEDALDGNGGAGGVWIRGASEDHQTNNACESSGPKFHSIPYYIGPCGKQNSAGEPGGDLVGDKMRCGLLVFRARSVWRFAGGALAGQELRGLIGEEQLSAIDQQPESSQSYLATNWSVASSVHKFSTGKALRAARRVAGIPGV